MTSEPWQNIDTILDVLEKAGCCRNNYVNAPEDVVANTLRDWLTSIYPQPVAATAGAEVYDVISGIKEFIASIAQFPNDDTFRYELDRAGAKEILAAIRAAENDALERAATRVVAFLSGSAPGRSIAQIIRDLKHDDFEPSDGGPDTSVETTSYANL